mgnify:FL=1|jgi:hypothetical protein|tara:strand:+ start:307 stop:447 length:141 start_codon:yes stop_codon:yes gene_type:complete
MLKRLYDLFVKPYEDLMYIPEKRKPTVYKLGGKRYVKKKVFRSRQK